MRQHILALLLPLAVAAPLADRPAGSSVQKPNQTIIAEWLQDLATLPFDHAGLGSNTQHGSFLFDKPNPDNENTNEDNEDFQNIPARILMDGICVFPTGLADGDLLIGRLPNEVPSPKRTGQMQVLNFPTYANWTEDDTWNVRLRAFIHEVPKFKDQALECMMYDWDQGFGSYLEDEGSYTVEDKRHYANISQAFFMLGREWEDQPLTVELLSDGGSKTETLDTSSVVEPVSHMYSAVASANKNGDIESQLTIDNVAIRDLGVSSGTDTSHVQKLNMNTPRGLNGNSTAYLLPAEGITILSDIDDTLRVAQIWNDTYMFENTFFRPFQPFMNMPEIFANWSSSIPDVHFHYLSSVPEQFGRQYLD